MTAFVLGATGFVGREVVRQLAVRGGRVVAHVRPDSRRLDEWRARFAAQGAEVDASPWQAEALGARLAAVGATQLFVCVGTTARRAPGDGVTGDIYQEVDLGLTRIAVAAAQASGARPRVVYLSSLGADPRARSPYLRARGQAEEVVRGAGLPWVIARPAIITGDRDEARVGERVAGAVGDGALAVVGLLGGRRLRDRYRSTTPDVLAAALIRLAEAPEVDRVADGADLR